MPAFSYVVLSDPCTLYNTRVDQQSNISSPEQDGDDRPVVAGTDPGDIEVLEGDADQRDIRLVLLQIFRVIVDQQSEDSNGKVPRYYHSFS